MLDIGGLILLVFSLVGVIKWVQIPQCVPQIIAIAAFTFLIYQVVFRRSKFAGVHLSALWIALTWIAGQMMVSAWGDGILAEVPRWTMLLITPVVIIGYHQVQIRFSPSSGKKLKLTRTEARHFTDWLISRKKETLDKNEMVLIRFDLGEEIDFENKVS